MSGIKIANGTAASSETTVDTNGNLHTALPTTPSQGGFATLAAEISATGDPVGRTVRRIESSVDGRLRVGLDTPLFDMSFEGTIVAQDRIQQATTTLTIAQTAGFITLNSGAVTTTTTNANFKTYRTFPLFGTFPTQFHAWAKQINETATNSVTEFGLGYVAAATAPTDGVFFRYNAGGQLLGVINYNGTETTVNLTSPATNNVHHYAIFIHDDRSEFWIDDALYGTITLPTSTPNACSAMNQPAFARVYFSGTGSAARQISIGRLMVTVADIASHKPWGDTITGLGGGSYQIQPGTASGPTVTRGTGALGWPTSATARVAGTWTATTAPALNSLGGLWLSPAISTLTSDADYPIFSYQNPTGTATLPGKTLKITGVVIGNTCVTTVGAVNSIVLAYGIGIGSTSSATTATEGAAIVAARIIPAGQVAFVVGAALGTYALGWHMDFSQAPLVCPPGTFVQFIVRPFGTVTTNTLVVAGSVGFIGYFE